MKSKITVIAGAIALLFGVQAAAQDCSGAIEIHSNQTGIVADTCAAGNPFPDMGGTPSGPNDVVYFFDANGANANITVSSPVDGATVYLMPTCATSADPIALGYQSGGVQGPMAINSTNSPDGARRYVVVSFDGSMPSTTCGTVTMDVDGTLPVELKDFAVN